MALKLLARTGICMATGFFALTMASGAFAQGPFLGTWKVIDVIKADWIEPNAEPQETPMSIGDMVEFGEGKVVANAALGCETANYKSTTSSQSDLFQRSIGVANSAAKIADRFDLTATPKSLLVDCDSGKMFGYYETRKGKLVTLFDSLVYTLERSN